MKIKNVVLSSNLDDTYIQFWPLVSGIWKRLFREENIQVNVVLGLLTDLPENSHFVKECRHYGKTILIRPSLDYAEPVQAKLIRLFLASKLEGGSILGDIDLIPLRLKDYITRLSHVPDNCIASYGSNAYNRTQDHFKVPMCYLSSSKETFQKITGITDRTTFHDFLKSLETVFETDRDPGFDGKESVLNRPESFSDESTLRYLIYSKSLENYQVKFVRNLFKPECVPVANGTRLYITTFTDRIDRHGGFLVTRDSKLGTAAVDFNTRIDRFIDIHGCRPFQRFIQSFMPVLRKLGIDINSTIPTGFRYGPFVTVDHYLSYCNKHIRHSFELNTLEIEPGDVIFLEGDLIERFTISKQPKSTCFPKNKLSVSPPYVDSRRDVNFKLIISPMAKGIIDLEQVQNLKAIGAAEIYVIDSDIPSGETNVYSLPFGFSSKLIRQGKVNERSNQYNFVKQLKPLSERAFNPRVNLPEILSIGPSNVVPTKEFFAKIENYVFCHIQMGLSPHLVFECIALGTIPIVSSGFVSKHSVDKLPVIFADKIEDITIESLSKTYEYYSSKPELFNTNPKINSSYWCKKITKPI